MTREPLDPSGDYWQPKHGTITYDDKTSASEILGALARSTESRRGGHL